MGTAAYISPEQAAGDPATPASDVYSFGVMLFRILTGQLPFTSDSAIELVHLHRDVPPPAVTDLRPDAPALLESITAAALAKEPAAERLRACSRAGRREQRRRDAATTALPVMPRQQARSPAPRRANRPPAVIGAVLLVLVLAGIALALAVTHGSGNSPPAAPSVTALSVGSTTNTTMQASTPPASTTQPTTSAVTTRRTTTRAASPMLTTTPVPTQLPTTAPTTTTVATTTAAPPTTTGG